MHCLGLMSGTSLDGVDASLLVTDGEGMLEPGPSLTLPYPDALRSRLRSVLGGQGPVAEVERDVTLFHAQTVRALLDKAGAKPAIDVVGFHGHTILHRPDQRRTWQIGDGALLARELKVPVVNDFRSADVAVGGQGAPLAPIYHRALATRLERPVAVLNLGGVGNVTYIGEAQDELVAFDTGPANALIDDWALRHTGQAVDHGGVLAAKGKADRDVIAAFLAHPYFGKVPPKSLDRDDFKALAARLTEGLSPADGAATLTAITIACVGATLDHLPQRPARWLVTGGGRHNPVIMLGLRDALAVPVEPIEAIGADGDSLEANAFAYMAARSLKGLPISFPGTTGVAQPLTGGTLHRPA
jgi:anhydro-N-acetylmuramic acid kinase